MNVNTSTPDENEELFYFESDHLALKGNKDYSDMLKSIFILDSQRAKAIKDYDTIVDLHKDALNDPYAFVQKLKDGTDLGIPDLQIIADVPNIQWSKFKVKIPEEGLKFINEKYNSSSDNANLVKLEKKHHNEADTHNKLWTTEEQRRLEELLVIYPPEPIEFRRFKKIAAALGNRTVKQVTSRVQKYFLKLYRAGLPIPGRIPKYAERTKKSKLHTHQRYNHYLFKPTTFFPHLDIPVVMNEAEPVPGPSANSTSQSSLSNYLIPEPLEHDDIPNDERKRDVEIQLNILRKVKFEKQKENPVQLSYRHFGYKCDYCNEEPITGVRWHCKTCVLDSIDFCSDCLIAQMYTGNSHPLSHKFESIKCNNTESGNQSDNSSSDSISGSAFDSSNKNFDSNFDSSCSDSETEQFCESKEPLDNCEYNSEKIKDEIMDLDDDNGEESNGMDMQDDSSHPSDYFGSGDCIQQDEFNGNGFMKVEEPMGNDHDKYIKTETDVSYEYLHSNLLLDST